ncbi:MAG: sodium-dependent transporter [Deltaproteobacteria bacterium]|nr:sodium-dependent transporter [Deltaproteobacteria bacterium]
MSVILALAGSAIGLGNIWRFPYMVGEYGGAAFIIVYLLFAFLISLPAFLAESLIGKRARKSTYDALETLAPGTPWKWLGLVAVAGAFIITSYYSVVGGWSLDFLARSAVNGFDSAHPEAAAGIFARMTGSAVEPLLAHALFLGFSSMIIVLGVKNGIGRFSKVCMPLLFVLIVAMMLFVLTLPGAKGGLDYLLKPDFSKLTPRGIACALGQSFYSMSIGMGVVLTYSSYMKKEQSILFTSIFTLVFDVLFAIIAGFVVMPAVFSAGLRPEAGPSLVFESIPYIFAQMGTASPLLSRVVSVAFFLTILIAALTSEISMIEVCVSMLIERLGWRRRKATALVFCAALLLGCFCSVYSGVFGFCDYISSNVFMMLGALAFTVFVGWRMEKSAVCEEIPAVFYFVIKYLVPPAILVIFFTNLL